MSVLLLPFFENCSRRFLDHLNAFAAARSLFLPALEARLPMRRHHYGAEPRFPFLFGCFGHILVFVVRRFTGWLRIAGRMAIVAKQQRPIVIVLRCLQPPRVPETDRRAACVSASNGEGGPALLLE
jgi:hypothetical protein